jgi:hypothetical protein
LPVVYMWRKLPAPGTKGGLFFICYYLYGE